MSTEYLKTWAWEHHCIEKTYGVDKGNTWLHKDVQYCSECDTVQEGSWLDRFIYFFLKANEDKGSYDYKHIGGNKIRINSEGKSFIMEIKENYDKL